MIQIQIWPRKYKQWIRKFKSVIKCEAQIQSNTNSPCSQLCTEYNLHSMKREQTRCTSKSSQNTKYGAACKSKVTCSVGFCPMWAKKARSRFKLLLWIKAERGGRGGGGRNSGWLGTEGSWVAASTLQVNWQSWKITNENILKCK